MRGDVAFETYESVAVIQDLGTRAESALATAHLVFGYSETEEQTAAHVVGDVVVLAIDRPTDDVAGISLLTLVRRGDLDGVRRSQTSGIDETAMGGLLNGSVVRPDMQGRGIYRDLNGHRITEVLSRSLAFLFTVTQNPAVENGLSSALDAVVGDGRLAGFELNRVVLPAVYGGLLNEHQAEPEGTAFEALDREAGDAFSLCFVLSYPPGG